MAERVGFEPTVPAKVQQFSRLPDSTTLAPLREFIYSKVPAENLQILPTEGRHLKLLFISFQAKKILHDFAATRLQNAVGYLCLMIQRTRVAQLRFRSDRAESFVCRAVD